MNLISRGGTKFSEGIVRSLGIIHSRGFEVSARQDC